MARWARYGSQGEIGVVCPLSAVLAHTFSPSREEKTNGRQRLSYNDKQQAWKILNPIIYETPYKSTTGRGPAVKAAVQDDQLIRAKQTEHRKQI